MSFCHFELFVHFCHHGDELLIFDNSCWEPCAAYPLRYPLLFGMLLWGVVVVTPCGKEILSTSWLDHLLGWDLLHWCYFWNLALE